MSAEQEGRGVRKVLRRLKGLLTLENRTAALETQVERLNKTLRKAQQPQERSRQQEARTREQVASVFANLKDVREMLTEYRKDAGQVAAVRDRLNYAIDQVDVLKSSMEVPQEVVEDFRRWRSENPLPERPLVSVTVATYNRPRLLVERCIPSVLEQTYDNFELLVVGDGCSEETERAVAEIDDPRLTFLNLPERGSYPEDPERRWMVAGTPALNEGLSMARGDFITHLDDDDEYVPERLEKLVRFAVEGDYDFVWHPFWWESSPEEWTMSEAKDFALAQITTSSVFYRSWFKKFPWNPDAHRLMEPGDWNRFRRVKYVNPALKRYPEPLLKHYLERNQA